MSSPQPDETMTQSGRKNMAQSDWYDNNIALVQILHTCGRICQPLFLVHQCNLEEFEQSATRSMRQRSMKKWRHNFRNQRGSSAGCNSSVLLVRSTPNHPVFRRSPTPTLLPTTLRGTPRFRCNHDEI